MALQQRFVEGSRANERYWYCLVDFAIRCALV